MPPSANKVAIVGAGAVGSAVAFALLLRHVAAEILVTDVDTARCHAQVSDLSDASFLSNTRITMGTPQEAGQADVIVITAGAHQSVGETRLDLLERNVKILRAILGGMQPVREDAIVLLVINPVDILTHFAQEISGLQRGQVIGSGTFLDSVRLQSELAREAKVSETDMHVHVLGEHGDSQFVGWAAATVGGAKLQDMLPLEQSHREALANATKNKAYEIIKVKGSTAFGIAAVVASICEAILFDHRQIRAVSHWQDRFQCCMSMPAVIGRRGVLSTVPVALSDDEKKLLDDCAKQVKETIDKVSGPHEA